MRHDVRIRRLIAEYGLEGYGLYNVILEGIAEGLDSDNPSPELEETSLDIARHFGIDVAKVEHMLWTCIEQQLITQNEITGRYVCNKIYKFLDDASKKNPRIREMIEKYKQDSGVFRKIPNNSEKVRLEEEEEVEEEEEYMCVSDSTDSSSSLPSSAKKGPPPPSDPRAFGAYWENRSRLAGNIPYPVEFERFWESYPRPVDKKGTLRRWARTLKKGGATVEELHSAAMGYRKVKVDHEGTAKQYLKHSTTFLGDTEPWRDYLGVNTETIGEIERVCPHCGAPDPTGGRVGECLSCGGSFE